MKSSLRAPKARAEKDLDVFRSENQRKNSIQECSQKSGTRFRETNA